MMVKNKVIIPLLLLMMVIIIIIAMTTIRSRPNRQSRARAASLRWEPIKRGRQTSGWLAGRPKSN